ncbi:MarR family transcriptional regulator [Pigmentiphaga aceris]|nr:MarR family transcriptional regulator [Pigmentiphaga aceris]
MPAQIKHLELAPNFRFHGAPSLPAANGTADEPRRDSPELQMMDEVVNMLERRAAVYAGLKRIATASQYGLSVGDLRALDLIVELGPLTTGQLTQLSGLSSGNITAIVDRLEANQMVRRSKHPLDRRVIVLEADRQQCSVLDVPDANRLAAGDMPGMDANTLAQVHAFLAQYLDHLRDDALHSRSRNGHMNTAHVNTHMGSAHMN